jgi:hypothetical protein
VINLKELFSGTQRVRANYCGVELVHHLRQPTNDEDLQYRKRGAEMRLNNRELKASDVSLNSMIWLYDTICERVTAEDADGEQDVPDFKGKIPNDLKIAVINAYLGRFEITSTRVVPREG